MPLSIEETFEKQENLSKEISKSKKNLTLLSKKLSNLSEAYFVCEVNACISLWNRLNDISNELILPCSVEGAKNNKINGEIVSIKEIQKVLDFAEKEIDFVNSHSQELLQESSERIHNYTEKYLKST